VSAVLLRYAAEQVLAYLGVIVSGRLNEDVNGGT
jgi:hypothetical protein